jgi:hypothetical protein
LPQDTVGSLKRGRGYFNDDIKSYSRVDFSANTGKYYGLLQYNPHEGECGTDYATEDYKYSIRMAAAGFSKIKVSPQMISTMGVNITGGSVEENNLTKETVITNYLFDVAPYFKTDLKWFGLGAGINLGNLRWIPANPINKQTVNFGTKTLPVMPGISLRAGRRDIFNVKYEYGYNFPAPYPVLANEISIGSGLGSKDNFDLRVGTGIGKNHAFGFFSVEGFMTKNFGMNFRYNFGQTAFNNSGYPMDVRSEWFIFGASYKFGFNK